MDRRIQHAPDGWIAEELKLLRHVQRNHPYLSIGVPPLTPWAEPCFFTSARSSPPCRAKPGIGVEFTEAVCERLGITCDFKPLNWTTQWVEQTQYSVDPQSVLKEAILNKEFDTTLPIFAIDYTTRTSLTYSLPVFFAEDAVLMKTHFVQPTDNTFLVKPFHPVVWLAIVLTLLAVVFADAACRFVAVCSRRQRRAGGSFWLSYFREVESTSLYQAGVLCQRNAPFDQPIVDWSRRVLVFAWGFASVLLCTTYSACLVSRRMAPEIVKPFSNLDEFGDFLSKKPDSKLMAIGQDAYFLRQIDHWPTMSAHLYESFRKYIASTPPTYIKNTSQAKQEIERGNPEEVLVYGSYITLRALSGDDCNVTIIPLNKGQALSYAFRVGSIHEPLFTKVVLNFLEQGYYVERLQQKYAYGRRCEFQTDQGGSQTTMAALYLEQEQQVDGNSLTRVHTMSLQLVFWALLCGYAFGGMALMTEFLHKDVICRNGDGSEEQRDGEDATGDVQITRL